jgi:hypothetical protein
MSYRPNAVQNRIIAFFEANPDEELTVDDMCVKFDCTEMQVRTALTHINERTPMRLQIVRVVKLAKVA